MVWYIVYVIPSIYTIFSIYIERARTLLLFLQTRIILKKGFN